MVLFLRCLGAGILCDGLFEEARDSMRDGLMVLASDSSVALMADGLPAVAAAVGYDCKDRLMLETINRSYIPRSSEAPGIGS